MNSIGKGAAALCAVGAALLAVSVLMPWVDIEGITVGAFDINGAMAGFYLAVGLIVLLLAGLSISRRRDIGLVAGALFLGGIVGIWHYLALGGGGAGRGTTFWVSLAPYIASGIMVGGALLAAVLGGMLEKKEAPPPSTG